MTLFEARQPPFNDIPAGAVVSGENLASSLLAVAGESSEITHVLAPSPQATPAGNPLQATAPDVFEAASPSTD